MVDIQSKLSKFKNLNLSKYINEALPRYERSILLTDKNNIERITKDVDTEIFKAFLLNSDSLLEVLYTYESVQNSLKHLEDVKAELRKITYNINNKENIHFVDKNRLEEFRNVLGNFSNDVGSFDTGSRVLVHFDVFSDMADNKHILLLTNDILIIGRIQPQVRKYQLVNAFSYSIFDVQTKDSDLFIVLSQSTMRYSGDKEKVKKFSSMFKDLTYSYTDVVDTKPKHRPVEIDSMTDYLISTEQYTEITNPKDITSIEPFIYKKDDLILFLEILNENPKEQSIFIVKFLISKFATITNRINKVMPLKELIDHIFEVFYSFNTEQQELLKNTNQVNILLMIEKQILMCLSLIEARIFNKRYYSDDVESVLGLIRDKLVFDGFDFTYLTGFFNKKKRHHNEECLIEAKKEIDVLLREMICK
ncbi:hypothetical protein NGRA_0771 [Nosema granulosis]|uniref:Uncharacterized protein n=1 Tax=Nosema granulosis TaxID=83296 RepID=A0A9P6L078_9MICR|nr:hypothetical protein NGRA_0771 [Nosema granulosis]